METLGAGEGGDMDYMMNDHCLYCLEILHFLEAGFISKQWMELAGGYQNGQNLSWGCSGACICAWCNFMSMLMKEINQ